MDYIKQVVVAKKLAKIIMGEGGKLAKEKCVAKGGGGSGRISPPTESG